MLENFYHVEKERLAVPILALTESQLFDYKKQQSDHNQQWLTSCGFEAKLGQHCLLAKVDGTLAKVLVGVNDLDDMWNYATLPTVLPPGHYFIDNALNNQLKQQCLIAWGLASYQFSRYKKSKANAYPSIYIDASCDAEAIKTIVSSTFLVRDLINTPASDLGPEQLASAVVELGELYQADVRQTIGEDLLACGYHGIYTVGMASTRPPRLVELSWGNKDHPKLTLVGKGVCFDSGGLSMKSPRGMLLMKKDMGGAAHALALAKMIMAQQLPVFLSVLIPTVDNVIAGNAYRPGDVITMYNGKTVEVSNTDAEGRLILADALALASKSKPDLLINFATLTGAARVALGTEISALFTKEDELALAIKSIAKEQQDPIWQLPLYQPYQDLLASDIADMQNASLSGYAGAIVAALFLQAFVAEDVSWLHFDLMGWNVAPRPGRPKGGEAMAIRALFAYIKQRYQNN